MLLLWADCIYWSLLYEPWVHSRAVQWQGTKGADHAVPTKEISCVGVDLTIWLLRSCCCSNTSNREWWLPMVSNTPHIDQYTLRPSVYTTAKYSTLQLMLHTGNKLSAKARLGLTELLQLMWSTLAALKHYVEYSAGGWLWTDMRTNLESVAMGAHF